MNKIIPDPLSNEKKTLFISWVMANRIRATINGGNDGEAIRFYLIQCSRLNNFFYFQKILQIASLQKGRLEPFNFLILVRFNIFAFIVFLLVSQQGKFLYFLYECVCTSPEQNLFSTISCLFKNLTLEERDCIGSERNINQEMGEIKKWK